jgi:hypothetical protein
MECRRRRVRNDTRRPKVLGEEVLQLNLHALPHLLTLFQLYLRGFLRRELYMCAHTLRLGYLFPIYHAE